jgi:hypothetical protein
LRFLFPWATVSWEVADGGERLGDLVLSEPLTSSRHGSRWPWRLHCQKHILVVVLQPPVAEDSKKVRRVSTKRNKSKHLDQVQEDKTVSTQPFNLHIIPWVKICWRSTVLLDTEVLCCSSSIWSRSGLASERFLREHPLPKSWIYPLNHINSTSRKLWLSTVGCESDESMASTAHHSSPCSLQSSTF